MLQTLEWEITFQLSADDHWAWCSIINHMVGVIKSSLHVPFRLMIILFAWFKSVWQVLIAFLPSMMLHAIRASRLSIWYRSLSVTSRTCFWELPYNLQECALCSFHEEPSAIYLRRSCWLLCILQLFGVESDISRGQEIVVFWTSGVRNDLARRVSNMLSGKVRNGKSRILIVLNLQPCSLNVAEGSWSMSTLEHMDRLLCSVFVQLVASYRYYASGNPASGRCDC